MQRRSPAVPQRRRSQGAGRGTAAAAVCGCLLAVATAAPAAAELPFAPGAIPASVNGTELGDRDSSSPLLSGDGRYLLFVTRSPVLLGTPGDAGEYYSLGLVRKDLRNGAIDVVATPERRRRSDGELVAPAVATQAGGVSADGRFVLLVSSTPLVDAVRSTITPEVYVRDMSAPRSDPSAYELVSALDGGDQPASYADRTAGSDLASALSLSDDGRTALFVSQTPSNLPAGGDATATPRWQLFVRDLDAQTTRLVTRDLGDPALPGTPVAPSRGVDAGPQALLSGDGRVAAWVGADTQRQARFLPGETTTATTRQLLWRDLAAGPAAAARRIAGEADPDDPACPPGVAFVASETATGPCYGPFAAPDDVTPNRATAPRLLGISDDGSRVLFAAAAKRRPFDLGAYRNGDDYLADMRPGVTRAQGVTAAWSQPASRAPVVNGTLAGDGVHAAFASAADRFDGLQPVGSFQQGDLTTPNLFAVDLGARTVERATTTPGGGDYLLAAPNENDTPNGVAISDDGRAIAFAANDGNLFVGDVNGVRDVQVVRRQEAPGGPPRRELPPAPPPPVVSEPPLVPLPRVRARIGRVRVDGHGVATVRVVAPAPGRLVASATGSVPRARKARARRAVVVGADRRALRRPATVTLRIAPSATVRRMLRRSPQRLAVTLRISFAATARAGSASASSSSRQRYTLAPPARARQPAGRPASRRRRGAR